MTPKDIDNMQAGRELDKLIAEKVMGWTDIVPTRGLSAWHDIDFDLVGKAPGQTTRQCLPYYSYFIGHAWQVVEKLTCTTKQWFHLDQHSTGCTAIFQNDTYQGYDADADAAPLAICRAALKAIAGDRSSAR